MRRFTIAILLCGCSTDLPAPPNLVDTSAGDTVDPTTAVPSTSDGSTTAGPEPVVVLDVRLDLEMRESIDVQVATVGTAVEITIDASEDYGVVQGTLVGPGRIDDYPELGAMLYTATFDGPAIPGGPCGDEPVSLALALHRPDDSDNSYIMAGGLTPYCGASQYFGVPAIEPLRIFGRIR
jgi:hypothetical protein